MRAKRDRRGSVLRAAAVLLSTVGLAAGIAAGATPAAADAGPGRARTGAVSKVVRVPSGPRTHAGGRKAAAGRADARRDAAAGDARVYKAAAGARQVAAGDAGPRQVAAGGTGGSAATAKPLVRMRRTRTRMSIGITPAHPYRNGRLIATGLVTQLGTRGWVHLPHAHVVLVYRPKGSSQWYWVLKGYADSSGHYTFVTTAYADGTWAVYLDPDSRHLYSETRKVYVAVR